LKNTGKAPILPGDYVEPLKVSVNKPFRILAIEKEKGNPQDLNVTWDRASIDIFQIKPMLLNPGDSFATLIFTDESYLNQTWKQSPSLRWSARIANISKLKLTSYQDLRRAEADALGIFYVTFQTSGWGIYTYSILSLVLFVFGLFCGLQFGVLKKVSLRYYVMLSALMGLSVISGATLSNRLHGAANEHWICNVALALYALLIVFFTFPVFRGSAGRNPNTANKQP
jgi:hypothetical protein